LSAAVDTGARTHSRPVRVLHLRDSPWLDGPGRTILETAGRIDRALVDYHIGPLISNSGAIHPLVAAARERGVPVHPIEDRGELAALTARVLALIDELGIEVLHSSELRTNLVALQCRRHRPSLKLVSTMHGWITNDLRGKVKALVDRALLRRFDRVIAVSNATRRRVPRWWLPEKRVVVLHNCIATERFARELCPAPPAHFAATQPVRLANIGRLSPEKGQAMLLQALATLRREFPRLRLSFVGTGPLESELRGLSERLGVSDAVTFTGYVTDMSLVYDETDLVVQSSFTEGLPNVIVEAAYVGLPIVATDVGGTAEVIEHEVSGWLVRPRSLEDLVAGIRRFIEEPGRFAAMRARARSKVEKEFTFAVRTARQADLYRELCPWQA